MSVTEELKKHFERWKYEQINEPVDEYNNKKIDGISKGRELE